MAKGKYAETGRTRASWFTLNARYKEWKDDKHPWLKQYTTANTRPMLRRFAKAHRREFKDGKGFPRFKKKGRAKPSFDVDLPGSKGKRIKDDQFRVREERWMVAATVVAVVGTTAMKKRMKRKNVLEAKQSPARWRRNMIR